MAMSCRAVIMLNGTSHPFLPFILRLDFHNICVGHFDHKDEILSSRLFPVGESLHFAACEVRT